jgi:uncharacterized protein
MRWHIDAWDPGYGTGLDAEVGSGPATESSAQLDAGVEIPPESWAPKVPPADLRAPDVVYLVDGVRRIDARVWTVEDDGTSYAGLAASYAAGVVRCDLRHGGADLVGSALDRGLFTASPSATDLEAGGIRYRVHRVTKDDPARLPVHVQPPLTELEVQVSTDVRTAVGAAGGGGEGDDLLVVDGPLRSRRNLARSIGYIKTHRSQYLPPQLSAVVTSLRPGERSPVFRLGTIWHSYTWYLRLPSPPGAPWTGIVRLECPIDLTIVQAVELADLSAVTLPRFASSPYKDPRAPQNLVPIGGLEKRLRAMLGDSRLLHRALVGAAARSVPATAAAGRV